MNIKQAKAYIKSAVNLYLKKDEFGEYQVPVVRQRPVFLLGAPGIGKTAIMEQIAQEMGIALVAYSMTHHTRQSALGLPFIEKKTYGGQTISVSEYTMSEIIASIYETMEKSGMKEGILFLDEINCVSETLAPSMLQFLQYKVFGRHSVPEGWVIVTAGNPPEFNKSVREFDVVTMDRLKLLEVEPDYRIWREYAADRKVHGAILNYLDLKKEHFYVMEMTTKGRSYVTARGWEDLSQMLYLYEEDGMQVEESLVEQYLRNDTVVKEFCAYYDLYKKYKKDYCVDDILAGHPGAGALAKAKAAAVDERLSLMGLLLDRVQAQTGEVMLKTKVLSQLKPMLQALSGAAEGKSTEEILKLLSDAAVGKRNRMQALLGANSLSDEEKKISQRVIRFLENEKKALAETAWSEDANRESLFDTVKADYKSQVDKLRERTAQVQNGMEAVFAFVEEAFGEGNEMLILVTELTVMKDTSGFIATFGCPAYNRHSKDLMLSERNQALLDEIQAIEL